MPLGAGSSALHHTAPHVEGGSDLNEMCPKGRRERKPKKACNRKVGLFKARTFSKYKGIESLEML